jgi:hypothetical protein
MSRLNHYLFAISPVHYTAEKPSPTSSLESAPNLGSEHLFCRITKAAYDQGNAQKVELELRSACVSAPKLIKAIRFYEALGYLDTQNLSSVTLYELLNEHFGLPFKIRNFEIYRSK